MACFRACRQYAAESQLLTPFLRGISGDCNLGILDLGSTRSGRYFVRAVGGLIWRGSQRQPASGPRKAEQFPRNSCSRISRRTARSSECCRSCSSYEQHGSQQSRKDLVSFLHRITSGRSLGSRPDAALCSAQKVWPAASTAPRRRNSEWYTARRTAGLSPAANRQFLAYPSAGSGGHHSLPVHVWRWQSHVSGSNLDGREAHACRLTRTRRYPAGVNHTRQTELR